MTIRRLAPHALTGLRLALALPLAQRAWAGDRAGFAAVVFLALLTELDGTVARALGVASEFGRRFDSWADFVLVTTGVVCLPLVWPELVARNEGWFGLFLAAYFVPVLYGIVRFGRVLGYHTWLARLNGALAAVGLVGFVGAGSSAGLRVMAIVEVLVAAEYLTIAMLRPAHQGSIASAWHAWRRLLPGQQLSP